MTEEKLKSYRILEQLEKDLASEISKLEHKQSSYRHSILGSGIGGIPSGGDISRPTETAALDSIEYFVEIGEQIRALEEQLLSVQARLNEIKQYIYSIEDEYIKSLFIKKYIQFKSWRRIALEYHYSPNSFIIIQKQVRNYLKSH